MSKYLFLLLFLALGCRGNVNIITELPLVFLELDTYGSCSELEVDLKDKIAAYKKRLKAFQAKQAKRGVSSTIAQGGFGAPASPNSVSAPVADSASAPASTFAGSAENNDILTNQQEEGVDEADYMKVGADHIFVGQPDGIEVVDRHSLKHLGKIDIENSRRALKLFVLDKTLVVLDTEDPRVINYALKSGKMPAKLAEKELKGKYVDSRLTDGRLVVVLNHQLFDEPLPIYTHSYSNYNTSETDPADLEIDGTMVGGIHCRKIVKPAFDIPQKEVVHVVSLDAEDEDLDSEQISLLGQADQIYMTQKHLYLAKYGSHVLRYLPSYDDDKANRYDTTVLQKVKLASIGKKTALGSVGQVRGKIKDQWAFNEYGKRGDILAVATTSRGNDGGFRDLTNNLFVLKQSGGRLKPYSSVEDFGRTEDIRSVRYIGDYAYIVTFKKTDPLFAINMKNLKKPKIESELKIPGFSTYMHPAGDGQMIGVGFDAVERGNFALFQGIQLSLFDTSDPKDVQRVDHRVIGARGSSSEVTGDHHAFYYDPAQKVIGLPIVELTNRGSSSSSYGNELHFSGAILFEIDGDQLVETHRLTHSEWIDTSCRSQDTRGTWWQTTHRSQDINRLFKVDGQLLTLSRWGIKAHNLKNPQNTLDEVRFDDVQCNRYVSHW